MSISFEKYFVYISKGYLLEHPCSTAKSNLLSELTIVHPLVQIVLMTRPKRPVIFSYFGNVLSAPDAISIENPWDIKCSKKLCGKNKRKDSQNQAANDKLGGPQSSNSVARKSSFVEFLPDSSRSITCIFVQDVRWNASRMEQTQD